MNEWANSRHDQIEIEREYCNKLINFVERAWHVLEPSVPFVRGWAIEAMCEHYEAITWLQIQFLLITIITGIGKSIIGNVMHPAWEWGPGGKPGARILSASFRAEHAIRDTRKMRMLITSDWYQKHWPIKLTSDQNEKKSFENEHLGFRQCCAVGSMTGLRADHVKWDDPISVKNANSLVFIKEAERIFRTVLPTRLNDPKTSTVDVTMQRVAKNDPADIAIEMGYTHLMLPMEFIPSQKCITSIGFSDPRTEENEPLFPERFDEKEIARLKKTLGRDAYSAQMQQQPNPIGGRIIKSKDFGLYLELPHLVYREIYADTAMKTKEHNDYSVLQCWGVDKKDNTYLLDQFRGKWEAPELQRKAIEFWAKNMRFDKVFYGSLRKMCVEDKASGTGLIQTLRTEGRIPIEPIKEYDNKMTDGKGKERGRHGRVAKDKYTRVCDILPIIEQGMVHLPKDAAWLNDFLDECESFTADNTHPHDDQVDTMVYAINNMVMNKVTPWWAQIAK